MCIICGQYNQVVSNINMAHMEKDESKEISSQVIEMLESFLDTKYGQQTYKYKVQGAAKKGDNYMGVVYRVTIISLNDNQQLESIILKVPPQNIQQRNQFFARVGFLRESMAYKEFLPLVKEFQLSKGLSASETFFEHPQCYFTSTEDLHETISMNDLQSQGFFMHNRFEPLTLEQILYVIKIYAKLHATSMAIKDQNAAILKSLKNIPDIFQQRKNDIQLNNYFESLKISALECVDNANDRAYFDKLQEVFYSETFYNMMLALLDSHSSEPYAVVCHGDCWINNIMFKEQNGKIVDARLIDWQIMRYASPITDLMYFLMTSTNRDFRQQHFKQILDVYYSCAAQHITKLGSDPETIFPRSAFDGEFKRKAAIGLFFSMIVLPLLTTKSEDVPDLEKLSEKVSAGHSTDVLEAGFLGAKSTLFIERMRGIIIDTIDWNLI